MIRVTALTSGETVPSARFRVRQHVESLAGLGIQVKEFFPVIDKNRPLPLWPTGVSVRYVAPLFLAWQLIKTSTRIPGVIASHSGDVTWLQRELVPGYHTLERAVGKPIVFDVDDAIWVARPFGPSSASAIARRAAVIVAGNTHIADWFSQYNDNIRLVPTGINIGRFKVGARSCEKRRFTLGWTGTAGNLSYLEMIAPVLWKFMADHPDVQLKVIADRPPSFKLPGGRIRFVRWSAAIEASALRDLDVGIMPLPDNDWTRGKCSFKMIQYMATGVPVIASPVGMNRDVLDMGEVGLPATTAQEWRNALEYLYHEREIRREWGRNARQVAERSFDGRIIAASLGDIFRQLA